MTTSDEAISVALASLEDTERLASAVAADLEPGAVLLLIGELGAGKTTFTRSLVTALGGTTAVTSPTFTLCHLYDTVPRVAHVDCWRLTSTAELADLDLDEVLDEGGVLVIEWGERARPLFGADALEIAFVEEAAGEDSERRIATITANSARTRGGLPPLRERIASMGLALVDLVGGERAS